MKRFRAAVSALRNAPPTLPPLVGRSLAIETPRERVRDNGLMITGHIGAGPVYTPGPIHVSPVLEEAEDGEFVLFAEAAELWPNLRDTVKELSGDEPADVWDALQIIRSVVQTQAEMLTAARAERESVLEAAKEISGGGAATVADALRLFRMTVDNLREERDGPAGARARVRRITGQEPTSTSHAITLMEAAIEGAQSVASGCERRANDALAELQTTKRVHRNLLEQLLVVLPVDGDAHTDLEAEILLAVKMWGADRNATVMWVDQITGSVPEGERTWPPTTRDLTASLQRVATALDLARGRAAAADQEAARHLQALHQREREFHALLLALRMIARLMGEGW